MSFLNKACYCWDRLNGRKIPKILHHHIPKTAGTSFNQALNTYYKKDRIMPKRWLSKERDRANPYEQAFQDFDLVYVHTNLLEEVPESWFVVSLIRHPVDRVVSLCADWARLKDDDLKELSEPNQRIKTLARTKAPSELFEYDTHLVNEHLKNGMVKSILGRTRIKDSIDQFSPQELAELALKRVEKKIDFMCDVTDLKKALPEMAKELGITRLTIPHLNKTQSTKREFETTEIRTIEAENQADMIFYQKCNELIQKKGFLTAKWQ